MFAEITRVLTGSHTHTHTNILCYHILETHHIKLLKANFSCSLIHKVVGPMQCKKCFVSLPELEPVIFYLLGKTVNQLLLWQT